jgi:hypothetical protein
MDEHTRAFNAATPQVSSTTAVVQPTRVTIGHKPLASEAELK